jgi:hypothetical protein
VSGANYHCSRCDKPGHNKRTCLSSPKPPKMTTIDIPLRLGIMATFEVPVDITDDELEWLSEQLTYKNRKRYPQWFAE